MCSVCVKVDKSLCRRPRVCQRVDTLTSQNSSRGRKCHARILTLFPRHLDLVQSIGRLCFSIFEKVQPGSSLTQEIAHSTCPKQICLLYGDHVYRAARCYSCSTFLRPLWFMGTLEHPSGSARLLPTPKISCFPTGQHYVAPSQPWRTTECKKQPYI